MLFDCGSCPKERPLRIWGISALSHDAALAVVEGDQILFAAHAERYSRTKGDPSLNQDLIDDAVRFGEPDVVAWYERPLLKKTRQLRAGQLSTGLDVSELPRRHLRKFRIPGSYQFQVVRHHLTHAAAGYLTSGFEDACVITVDAIGEWDCTVVGVATRAGFRAIRRTRYPHSLGLLYSAFTRRCGFAPNDGEYSMMGLAPLGQPRYVDAIYSEFVERLDGDYRLKVNVHRGIGNWMPEASAADLAASIQAVMEAVLLDVTRWARQVSASQNLVLMGGVALNCVANSVLASSAGFDKIWTMPNPGDAGSSLGAAASVTGAPLRWEGPYLGTSIDQPYQHRAIVDALVKGEIVGVANGRAEFGPRALGNRSLLCDPRGLYTKDRINKIKGREPFRPFAPAVLAEHAHGYFELLAEESPYMQFVARCRRPDRFPAIVHVDGTSRIQTVNREQNQNFHDVLAEYFRRTSCPMLLNTSLNRKGEPIVNSWSDATAFSKATGVRVF